jgi:hypothetical protein
VCHPRGRAVAAGPHRLRPADGGQAGRSDRWRRSLQVAGGLRPTQRHGAGPGLVGQPGPSPPEPGRRPSVERRPASHRHHPASARGTGTDYLAKRQAAGDTKTEAIRALRRRLSDEVFRRLTTDEIDRANASTALTAAAA